MRFATLLKSVKDMELHLNRDYKVASIKQGNEPALQEEINQYWRLVDAIKGDRTLFCFATFCIRFDSTRSYPYPPDDLHIRINDNDAISIKYTFNYSDYYDNEAKMPSLTSSFDKITGMEVINVSTLNIECEEDKISENTVAHCLEDILIHCPRLDQLHIRVKLS
jgi:hypothetical protein